MRWIGLWRCARQRMSESNLIGAWRQLSREYYRAINDDWSGVPAGEQIPQYWDHVGAWLGGGPL